MTVSTRLLACLALAGALSGCGTSPVAEQQAQTASASTVGFDQALHDRLPEALRADGVLEVATDATYPPTSAFAKRRKQADFVDHYSAGTSIVVQRGNPDGIVDLRDLCGRTVAAEASTVQVDLLARTQRACGTRRIVVREFPDNARALVELRTGRAAAVLNDYPPAVALTTDTRTSADFQLASTVQCEPGFYGIALRKEDTGLRDALSEALRRLVRSGEYGEVLTRWGVSSGALGTVSVNGGAVDGQAG